MATDRKSIEGILSGLCSNYQIDPAWARAIITVESSWNPYAIRYEVNYQYLLTPEKFAKSAGVSLSTEIATQKMSWGLGQTMGALAREQGHMGMLAELVLPEVSLKHLCIRLDVLKKKVQTASDVFACYNGGLAAYRKVNGVYINQSYVDKVNSFLKS